MAFHSALLFRGTWEEVLEGENMDREVFGKKSSKGSAALCLLVCIFILEPMAVRP